MNQTFSPRGAAPVGYVTELDPIAAGAVLYLRLWCDGRASQEQVCRDFALALGQAHGERAVDAFGALCDMCERHARRPLMRHQVSCRCLGGDESCFGNFIATAAEGQQEDALLMAMLLVRPEMAHCLVGLATDVGLALHRMVLRAPVTRATHDGHNDRIH